MRACYIALITIIVISCGQTDMETDKVKVDSIQIDTTRIESEIPVQKNYSFETYSTDSIGWGYLILVNEKPYINQPHIPAIPGNSGFNDEDQANIMANFVIYKLKNGIMPPSISIAELDSLGIER
jgi:hypothetical protein